MKKSLITLLSILILTACTPQTTEFTTIISDITSTAVTATETTIESTSVTEENTSTEKITEAIIEESLQPAFKDNYDITDEELLKKFDEAYDLYISGQWYTRNEDGIFMTNKGETVEQVRQKYLNYFTDEYMEAYYDIYGLHSKADSTDEHKAILFLWYWNSEEMLYRISQHGHKYEDFIKLDIENLDNIAEYDIMNIGGCFDTLITVYDTEEIIKREDNKIILTKTVLHCTPEQGSGTAYEVINGKPVIQGVHEKDENGEFYIAETELTGTIDESITADT
ncbi:MAG: hypothetical protein IJ007_08700, partial [Oscillospiraceae bacterium]|nr:hypothetical protein [Oscillospiraceae bacterium]